MREPSAIVQTPVREQFSILADNIQTLTDIKKEVGPGSIGRVVDQEVGAQILALGELRERVLLGVISGSNPQPLESPPARIQIASVSDYQMSMLARLHARA